MLDLDRTDHDRWTLAQAHLDAGDPIRAAAVLTEMGAGEASSPLAARMLLARALFASAQLGRAEAVVRSVVADRPDEAHAHLLLARVLQRTGRRAEAQGSLRLVAAMSPQLLQG